MVQHRELVGSTQSFADPRLYIVAIYCHLKAVSKMQTSLLG